MKKKKYWAGFCDYQLSETIEGYGANRKMPAIYLRKKDALQAYQDVRPVEVKEIKSK